MKAAVNVAIILAFAGVLVLLVALTQSVYGWKALSVQTGSMRPAINPGDLVLVKSVPPSSLRVGDVITYINPANKKQTITHRLMAINGLQLITKGDANKSADQVVGINSVVGRVGADLPHAGVALNFLKTWPGIVALVYIPAFFIVMIELRRLSAYYKTRQVYRAPGYEPLIRSNGKNKLAVGAKLFAFFFVVVLVIAVPVRAALQTTARLTGNTISTAATGQGELQILLRRVAFECGTDNTPNVSNLVEILMYNPNNEDLPTGNWYIESSSGRVTTFRPQTVFDARDDFDIEPDMVDGLRYAGDFLVLRDAAGNPVDGLSWGSNIAQFNPALPAPNVNTVFQRTSPTRDTNTAADWQTLSQTCQPE